VRNCVADHGQKSYVRNSGKSKRAKGLLRTSMA
jgi:hypothetical protein